MAATLRLPVLADESSLYFEVPADVVAALGAGKRPAVRTTINGLEYRTRIAVYGGRFLIGLRREVIKQLNLTAGQAAELTLELDDVPREVHLPDDLAAALANDPQARSLFDALAFTHRKEYVAWVEGAKRADTRARRVAGATALLKSGRRTPMGPAEARKA
jgi:hypothetical protein